MRWYCVSPSLPQGAQLRVRTRPSASAPESSDKRLNIQDIVNVPCPPQRPPWFQIRWQQTEGYVMASTPDDMSLLVPWEDTSFLKVVFVYPETELIHVELGHLVVLEMDANLGVVEILDEEYYIVMYQGEEYKVPQCEVVIMAEKFQSNTNFHMNPVLPKEATIAIRQWPSKESDQVDILHHGREIQAEIRSEDWIKIHTHAWVMWRTPDNLELLEQISNVDSCSQESNMTMDQVDGSQESQATTELDAPLPDLTGFTYTPCKLNDQVVGDMPPPLPLSIETASAPIMNIPFNNHGGDQTNRMAHGSNVNGDGFKALECIKTEEASPPGLKLTTAPEFLDERPIRPLPTEIYDEDRPLRPMKVAADVEHVDVQLASLEHPPAPDNQLISTDERKLEAATESMQGASDHEDVSRYQCQAQTESTGQDLTESSSVESNSFEEQPIPWADEPKDVAVVNDDDVPISSEDVDVVHEKVSSHVTSGLSYVSEEDKPLRSLPIQYDQIGDSFSSLDFSSSDGRLLNSSVENDQPQDIPIDPTQSESPLQRIVRELGDVNIMWTLQLELLEEIGPFLNRFIALEDRSLISEMIQRKLLHGTLHQKVLPVFLDTILPYLRNEKDEATVVSLLPGLLRLFQMKPALERLESFLLTWMVPLSASDDIWHGFEETLREQEDIPQLTEIGAARLLTWWAKHVRKGLPGLQLCDLLVPFGRHRATKVRAAAINILVYAISNSKDDRYASWLKLMTDTEVQEAIEQELECTGDQCTAQTPPKPSSLLDTHTEQPVLHVEISSEETPRTKAKERFASWKNEQEPAIDAGKVISFSSWQDQADETIPTPQNRAKSKFAAWKASAANKQTNTESLKELNEKDPVLVTTQETIEKCEIVETVEKCEIEEKPIGSTTRRPLRSKFAQWRQAQQDTIVDVLPDANQDDNVQVDGSHESKEETVEACDRECTASKEDNIIAQEESHVIEERNEVVEIVHEEVEDAVHDEMDKNGQENESYEIIRNESMELYEMNSNHSSDEQVNLNEKYFPEPIVELKILQVAIQESSQSMIQDIGSPIALLMESDGMDSVDELDLNHVSDEYFNETIDEMNMELNEELKLDNEMNMELNEELKLDNEINNLNELFINLKSGVDYLCDGDLLYFHEILIENKINELNKSYLKNERNEIILNDNNLLLEYHLLHLKNEKNIIDDITFNNILKDQNYINENELNEIYLYKKKWYEAKEKIIQELTPLNYNIKPILSLSNKNELNSKIITSKNNIPINGISRIRSVEAKEIPLSIPIRSKSLQSSIPTTSIPVNTSKLFRKPTLNPSTPSRILRPPTSISNPSQVSNTTNIPLRQSSMKQPSLRTPTSGLRMPSTRTIGSRKEG